MRDMTMQPAGAPQELLLNDLEHGGGSCRCQTAEDAARQQALEVENIPESPCHSL